MKKHLMITLTAICFALGLTLIASTDSMAVHKGAGDLTCGSCHTMHSSQGGTNAPAMGEATGSFILLRASGITDRKDIHVLCLQCHSEDGPAAMAGNSWAPYNVTPPKVHLSTTAWTGGGFTNVGAGGDFSGECGTSLTSLNCLASATALGKGHSLGSPANVVPPGNSADGTVTGAALTNGFSCTACHDPHGTSTTTADMNKYRNLKTGAVIAPGAANPWPNTGLVNIANSYVGGITGTALLGGTGAGVGSTLQTHIWPVYDATLGQNSYSADAAKNTDALQKTAIAVYASRFCAQCHGAWHEPTASAVNNNVSAVASALGEDWTRHPTQRSLVDQSPNSGGGVDIVRYTNYNAIAAGDKVPAAQINGGTTYYADDSGDAVFCLSCHFAHGSPFNDILRWNYTSAVLPGEQTGVGVPSTTGCQQCHNR